MKKFGLLLFLFIFIGVLGTACGSSSSDSTSTDPNPVPNFEDEDRVATLNLTGSMGNVGEFSKDRDSLVQIKNVSTNGTTVTETFSIFFNDRIVFLDENNDGTIHLTHVVSDGGSTMNASIARISAPFSELKLEGSGEEENFGFFIVNVFPNKITQESIITITDDNEVSTDVDSRHTINFFLDSNFDLERATYTSTRLDTNSVFLSFSFEFDYTNSNITRIDGENVFANESFSCVVNYNNALSLATGLSGVTESDDISCLTAQGLINSFGVL